MATKVDSATPYSLPSASHLHPNRASTPSRSHRKPWQSRRHPSFRSTKSPPRVTPEEEQRLSREQSRISTVSSVRQPKWWKIRLFRGMINDVKRRAPFYASDWKDAWDYRVVPATVYMYFAKYAHNATSSSNNFLTLMIRALSSPCLPFLNFQVSTINIRTCRNGMDPPTLTKTTASFQLSLSLWICFRRPNLASVSMRCSSPPSLDPLSFPSLLRSLWSLLALLVGRTSTKLDS